MLSEHLKLLIKRESKEVLGRRYSNLWLLSLVLTAMFLSIAFSNGSLNYLSYKMNDPFTNWVNISNGYGSSNFGRFQTDIEDPAVQQHYGFSDVQADNQFSLSFVGSNGRIHLLQTRFFGSLSSDLVKAILSDDNVIEGCSIDFERLNDHSVGFIITEDVLHKLNYTNDNIPGYIDHQSPSAGADTLGIELIGDLFARAPVPVLGVVKRLPGNMDMIAARYFYEQYDDNMKFPFNLNNLAYQQSLIFFADETVGKDQLLEAARAAAPDSLRNSITIASDDYDSYAQLASWKPGEIFSIYIDDINLLPIDVVQGIAAGVNDTFKDKADVKRLYDYDDAEHHLQEHSFLSVNFSSLDSIRAFEAFAKDGYNVQIEMSQVNAKENFNAVSVMANILSWAMIIFSMVCIIMFIVNMLQSYFQKVKRNIGTFKAFGINSESLISVYSLIIGAIVAVAIIIALAIAWGTQGLLPYLGVMKDGTFNYLSLWNMKTVWSIVIVIIATLLTVRMVMGRLLHQTPGDLIYDRN